MSDANDVRRNVRLGDSRVARVTAGAAAQRLPVVAMPSEAAKRRQGESDEDYAVRQADERARRRRRAADEARRQLEAAEREVDDARDAAAAAAAAAMAAQRAEEVRAAVTSMRELIAADEAERRRVVRRLNENRAAMARLEARAHELDSQMCERRVSEADRARLRTVLLDFYAKYASTDTEEYTTDIAEYGTIDGEARYAWRLEYAAVEVIAPADPRLARRLVTPWIERIGAAYGDDADDVLAHFNEDVQRLMREQRVTLVWRNMEDARDYTQQDNEYVYAVEDGGQLGNELDEYRDEYLAPEWNIRDL